MGVGETAAMNVAVAAASVSTAMVAASCSSEGGSMWTACYETMWEKGFRVVECSGGTKIVTESKVWNESGCGGLSRGSASENQRSEQGEKESEVGMGEVPGKRASLRLSRRATTGLGGQLIWLFRCSAAPKSKK